MNNIRNIQDPKNRTNLGSPSKIKPLKSQEISLDFSRPVDTSILLSENSTTRTTSIFKKMLGMKKPKDYISQGNFYEPSFKLTALVPRMEDVKMVLTPTTQENLEAIGYAAVRSRQPVYLRGTTGMGKTNLVLYSMAVHGMPLYEISGEDSMSERNLIGRMLPGIKGGFVWQDGKVPKAIKPVTQVPLPVLEKPAKANLLPEGTIVNLLQVQEQNGESGKHVWVQIEANGKKGWVMADSLSRFQTPQTKVALKDSPDGRDGFVVKPGDLLAQIQTQNINGETWVQVKTPVKNAENPLKRDWKEGWVKASDLSEVSAVRYGTPLFEEPPVVKGIVEPGVSLYWEERIPDKQGGNITWSRVFLPNEYNLPGDEVYIPDCAPRPENPVLEHNFIRASALLLDEANLIQPGVKKRLNSLLDHRRMLVMDENRNEKVKRHPTSLIFLTGNPLSYSGREQESADFLRRCHVVSVQDYKPRDYVMILQDKAHLDNFTRDRIIGFHIQMVEMARKGIIGRRTGPYAYGTRDLIKLASHVNKLMPKVSYTLQEDTPIYASDINPEGNGMMPVAGDPLETLKAGETVSVLSHEQHRNSPWTRVQYGNGKIGYIKGKIEKESLYQLVWKEARKIYERRIVDDKEKNGVEVQLGLFFNETNKPTEDELPVIKKLDDNHYQFGDVVLPIDPSGGKNVPDRESANLVVNEKTPEAARRVVMMAEQIYHGDDTMLVGPTASGKTSYPSYVAMLLNRNLSYFNASDQTDKTRFIGKLVQKKGGGQFDFEWQNGLLTEAIVPKAIRPTTLYAEPGAKPVEEVPQNTPLYYLKQQKTVNGVKYSLVQKHEDWIEDREQTGKNAMWVKDDDIKSDIIIIDEGNAARSGALEGANSLFDKNRRFLMLEDFDGRKVYAHPSCVIFFTANPPEYGGLRYTGVNQISPAARNRFTEIWFPEVSPMPTASDVNDHSLDAKRQAEDAELKAYMETWLKGLPNSQELSDWAVRFYREVRNMAARHEIGATRPSGEPLIYTIGNLKNLAQKIKEFASDPTELRKYIGREILSSNPAEIEEMTKQAQENGASEEEILAKHVEWLKQKVEEQLSSMTPEEKLTLGGRIAFVTQAYHEFTDDFESDKDKAAVRALIQSIVGTPSSDASQQNQAA
jgi:MoxR-like ATPase